MLNIIQGVSNKWIFYKVPFGGRAGASPEWTVPTAPGVCALGMGQIQRTISLLVILCIIVYGDKKKKNIGYRVFSKPIIPIMVKYLSIGKNIGNPIYRSISSIKC